VRIARFRDPESGFARRGIVKDDAVFAAAGDQIDNLDDLQEIGPVDEVDVLAPVSPGKIICVGLNYVAHVTERDATRAIPEEPVLFMKPPTAVIGPGQAIEIAHLDHATDYEAELAVVIGRTARDVSESDALSHVFGFTCGNDVSDRVLQKKDGQWVRAKGFDTYCPLGPWIETELDLAGAPVLSRLNGEVRQSATTTDMIFSVPFLVSFISKVMTLNPTDVIMTGTPFGVAPLRPGDEIEVEVGGIGTLRNSVIARAWQ
jgi:2-keto-4-pentenoate hydratase/2-oxohepta-3-ene-1,7-dioic acid hydratase in catechol pathway